ncbi:putative membrane protein YgcG [Rhodobium orientis]|uniref:Uncharacterized protein n=1 Tax=Rhodobium orientis TaxID=34017 RepID=A0A327JF57_9HYPH|nr:hypothetical protein [Rhodobium orientis]MBB4301802.1 putative membrane protein YgcG [Rhodobium orientis]MBK5950600.1 hypothetical protein [Rhodobium orientis]RAI24561.1 hypothetical protein CH339_22135 [Rhodobium orientis]
MISGRNALSSIEQALADLRREENDVKGRLQAATERLAAVQAEQTDAYQDLARFRLDDHAGKALRGRLDTSAKRARQLLAERKDVVAEITARREKVETDLEKLAQLRTDRTKALEAAGEKLDAASAEAENVLADNEAWQKQHAIVEAAAKVIGEAERKAETAESDRKEKGAPYEADPLFMYLWERGYGTSRYKAGNIARMLDAWVAGLVRYQDARPNYAMLTEIPKRLREHVEKMKEKAQGELAKLKALEKDALERVGGAGLDVQMAKLRTEIHAFDKRFGELNGELDRLRAEEDRVASGEDETFNAAVAALGDSLKDDDTRRLWKEAKQTPSPEDERILERIEKTYDDMHDCDMVIETARKDLRRISRRRDELTEVAQDFRRRRYDDYGSNFADDAIIGSVLGEFLRGGMSGRDYWSRIERGHRHAPRRGPIGGGFPGIPGGGGPWGGGGGGGDFGGGGGDGFSTGDTF